MFFKNIYSKLIAGLLAFSMSLSLDLTCLSDFEKATSQKAEQDVMSLVATEAKDEIAKLGDPKKEAISSLELDVAEPEQLLIQDTDSPVVDNFAVQKAAKNKAIIIVPGIAASELFSAKDQQVEGVEYPKGYRIWPPRGITNFLKSESCLAKRLYELDILRDLTDFNMLPFDEQGKERLELMRSNPIADCRENPENLNFGCLDLIKTLATSISESPYLMDHDVVLFSYDWRRDNAESAQELEKFIDEKQYTDVILIAHSMGGLVCSSYLSKTENRQRTSKFIPVAVPFLGAIDAIHSSHGELPPRWLNQMFTMFLKPIIKKAVQNIVSIYELFPPKQFFDLLGHGYIDTYESWYIFGKQNEHLIDSYEESLEVLKQILYDDKDWRLLERAQEFHDSLRDEEGKILAFKGPTEVYNISGYNLGTEGRIIFEYKDGKFLRIAGKLESSGDGLVLLPDPNFVETVPHQYYVNDVVHNKLIADRDVVDLIINIIRGNPEVYSTDHISVEPPQ